MAKGLRELRREQIVEVARRIVARDGLEALTIASLEESLDFSRGVITYHFDDKDEILRAVLMSAVQEIDAELDAVPRDLGAEDHLRRILGVGIEGFIARPDAVRVLFAFWGRIAADPEIWLANRDLYRSYRDQARAFMRRHRARIADVSTEGMAGLMVGTVIGITVQYYFDPDAFDPQSALDEACAAVGARLFTRED